MNRPQQANLGDNAFLGIGLKSSKENCKVRLWYWFSDSNYATINIYTRLANSQQKLIIKSISDANTNWYRLDVNVPPIGSNFQLLIEGVLGPSRDGFLAIDDISFTPECSIDNTVILQTTTTTTRITTTPGTGTNPTIISTPKTTTTTKPIGYCPLNYCQNGGTCKVFNSSPFCYCNTQFTGSVCETEITIEKKSSS